MYTWPEYRAKGYYCAPYRTTEAVYRETITDDATTAASELPTLTANPTGSGMGTEHGRLLFNLLGQPC